MKLQLAPIETKDPELLALYAEAAKMTGQTTPDVFTRSLAVRPDLARALTALAKKLIAEGRLPSTVSQLIGLVISAQYDCEFCVLFHKHSLERLGMGPDLIQQCIADPKNSSLPELHSDILVFARKAAKDPNSISEADLEALRIGGLSTEEIIEVAVSVAFTRMLNTWADANGLEFEHSEPRKNEEEASQPPGDSGDEPKLEESVDSLYKEILAHGFGQKKPINFFTALSPRLDILGGVWELTKSLLVDGKLPNAVKQMIALSVSIQNQCRYCSVVHRGALESAGIDSAFIDSCANDPKTTALAEPERSIVQFALKAARAPAELSEEDFEGLRSHGLSDGEIVEVVMMAGFTNFINAWADIRGIPLDDSQ